MCQNQAWLSKRFNWVCRYQDDVRLTARSFQDVSPKKVIIYINGRRVVSFEPVLGQRLVPKTN